MPLIICLEPGCGAFLANPCEPLMALFMNKSNILKNGDGRFNLIDNTELRRIDSEIEENLGLQDHQSHFNAFANPQRRASTAGPKIFLMKCFRNHRHQYNINCP